jgi:ATP phosphoribosyltransferase
MPPQQPAFAAARPPVALRPAARPMRTCRRTPPHAVDSQPAPVAAAAAAPAPAPAVPAATPGAGRPRVGLNPGALLTMGLPKGSLLDSTLELMGRAGWNISLSPRSYYAKVNDSELNLLLFRSQEMARYVAMGCVDCGIAGRDWILDENGGVGVVDVGGLNYSKGGDGCVRWVLAVKESSPVRSAEDLAGGVVSTELVATTRRWFESRGIEGVRCEFSWGATEIKARAGLVDAICDVTETGDSIRANGLRIVDVIMESGTRLIANPAAWADPARRAKIEEVMLLLDGALQGRRRVGVKMNVPVEVVEEVKEVLAGFSVTSPTISALVDDRFVSMEVITEARCERLIIPKLKLLGCLGIFSYNLNMLVA